MQIQKPTIADLTSMNHTHAAAGATGGTIANITGNAATVTNATLTTTLTVNTGAVTLVGNIAGSTLTLGAGSSSVSGTNTGDASSFLITQILS